jgi:hypothetical protein
VCADNRSSLPYAMSAFGQFCWKSPTLIFARESRLLTLKSEPIPALNCPSFCVATRQSCDIRLCVSEPGRHPLFQQNRPVADIRDWQLSAVDSIGRRKAPLNALANPLHPSVESAIGWLPVERNSAMSRPSPGLEATQADHTRSACVAEVEA